MELKLRNLTKKYGNFTALSQLSVTFTPGIYGILGANGAGKSTIMNLISDNLKRSTGEILWNGQEILSLGRKFRKVLGFMPQQQGYYDRMTVDFFSPLSFSVERNSKKAGRPRNQNSSSKDQSL